MHFCSHSLDAKSKTPSLDRLHFGMPRAAAPSSTCHLMPAPASIIPAICHTSRAQSIAGNQLIRGSNVGYMKISLKGNEKNQCIECVSAASIYGISTYMYHQHQPNVGRYTTHGFYGVHIHIPKYMCVPLLCGPLQVHPLGTTHPCVSSDSLFRCHVKEGLLCLILAIQTS